MVVVVVDDVGGVGAVVVDEVGGNSVMPVLVDVVELDVGLDEVEVELSSVVVVSSTSLVVVETGRVVDVVRGRSSAGFGGIVDGVVSSPQGFTGRPPVPPATSTCAAGIHTTAEWSSGDRNSIHASSSVRPVTTTRSARPTATTG